LLNTSTADRTAQCNRLCATDTPQLHLITGLKVFGAIIFFCKG